MKRSGEALRALTYRVLVNAFWEEGKTNEAVEAVQDMEQRGVIGTASVSHELACCLCKNGRWQDAMIEVDKMKKLPHRKPLEITFTGLIMASVDGGHAKELFEEINKAKSGPYDSLNGKFANVIPDGYTFSLMLEASASALQWEYFEYDYKEMALCGYQLDQTKYAILLVEASRDGKWYLLGHAFETFLEGREIPHPLFFTEMLIQATSQSNYEKAVTLVNTMAHAPFQVSEKQWTELFEEYGDRIAQGSLAKLLDALSDCELSSKIMASNLLRSLQSFCGSAASTSSRSYCTEVTGKSEPNGNNGETYGIERLNILSIYGDVMGEETNAAIDPPVKATDVSFAVFSANWKE
ncbi:hypothetical protein CRYUN_Cryun15aG0110900 [Craigia yunnanensis]